MESFVTAPIPDYKLFWSIFMLLNGSNTSSFQQHAGVQLEGRGGGLPYPFLKIKKKCPDFRKKGHDCVHPYVNFTL